MKASPTYLSREIRPQPAADAGDIADTTHLISTLVPTVLIERPLGSDGESGLPQESWLSSPCYHFDFQGVKQGTPGMYTLDIQGNIDPSPPFGYQWTLDAMAGSLLNTMSATPTHLTPLSKGSGMLRLKAIANGKITGDEDKKRLRIYDDHLERDYDNFGTGTVCGVPWKLPKHPDILMSPWNCHGSTRHHYDGAGGGSVDGAEMAAWLSNFTPKKIVTVTHQQGAGHGDHPDLGQLARGDIVAYYDSSGNIMHTQTCTGNGTETYGANNEPLSYPGAPANQSWKWATSPAGDWANNLYWPDWDTGGSDLTPVTIKVYAKPQS